MGFYKFEVGYKHYPALLKGDNKRSFVSHCPMHFDIFIPESFSEKEKYNRVVNWVLDHSTPGQRSNMKYIKADDIKY